MMAALLLATFLTAIILGIEDQHKPRRFIAYVGIIVLSAWQMHILTQTWTMHAQGGYRDMTAKLNDLSELLPAECRILSEDTGVNFYAQRPVIQLYSKTQRPILHAKTAAEIDQLLSERHLCAVVLYSGLYIDIAGAETPLMQTLESKLFTRHEHLTWRIYMRN
jgi:hypothetical protein